MTAEANIKNSIGFEGVDVIAEFKKIECCTLFVEDLASVRDFYENIFGLKIVYQDKVSAVFKFSDLMINILQITEAAELIEPAQVAKQASGSRFMFTICLIACVVSIFESNLL